MHPGRKVLLVGAGEIAHEYVRALKAMGIVDVHVMSRTRKSAEAFCDTWNLTPAAGNDRGFIAAHARSYDGVIIASPIETLLPYLRDFVEAGAKRILVEKPVVLRATELDGIIANYPQAPVMVALNRLFFPSIERLRQQLAIEKVRSAEFSFTEWVHRIQPEKYAPEVLARWGAANCIHVIATAFDLIGLPRKLSAHVGGSEDIPWHPAGSIFSGCGETIDGSLFSYGADWMSAGRWSLTVRTSRGSYQLEPMEQLTFCPKGSVTREVLVPNWTGSTKCGFVEMLTHWMSGSSADRRFGLEQLRGHLAAVGTMLYGEAL